MNLVTYRITVSVDVTLEEGAQHTPYQSPYGPEKPAVDMIDLITDRARKEVRKAVTSQPKSVSAVHYEEAEPAGIVGPATAVYVPLLLVQTP